MSNDVSFLIGKMPTVVSPSAVFAVFSLSWVWMRQKQRFAAAAISRASIRETIGLYSFVRNPELPEPPQSF